MNKSEAIAYIENHCWSTTRLGIVRTQELLEQIGNPQKKLKFIHVAGSNGKGSTCAMFDSILREAGYKTGLYISPYIQDFCERVQVNGKNIDGCDLARITEIVRDIAEKMEDHPSQFEVITTIAMQYFYEQQCDIVVLEVGMGGALDSTNAIDAPELACITNIGLEHTEYLGNTLEEIARTKAGIIKPGCSCVCYDGAPEVTKVVKDVCAELNVPLGCVDFSRLLKLNDATVTPTVICHKNEQMYPGGENCSPAHQNTVTEFDKNIFSNSGNASENCFPGQRGFVPECEKNVFPHAENNVINTSDNTKGPDKVNKPCGYAAKDSQSGAFEKSKIRIEFNESDDSDKFDKSGDSVKETPENNYDKLSGQIFIWKNAENNGCSSDLKKLQHCKDSGFSTTNQISENILTAKKAKEAKESKTGSTEYKLSLIGNHQLHNAALVLTGIELLQKKGWHIPDEAIINGLKNVKWPARFEVLSREPVVILDGGHNPQCAKAMTESLEEIFPGKKVTFLTGVLQEKDYVEITNMLIPFAKEFVCVTPVSDRALSGKAFCRSLTERGAKACACETVEEGILAVLNKTSGNTSDKISDETSDVISDNTFGKISGMTSDVTSDKTSDATSDATSGKTSGMTSGMTYDVTSDKTSDENIIVIFGSLYLAGEVRTLFHKIYRKWLRKIKISARDCIPAETRKILSERIVARITESDEYKNSEKILIYEAVKGEASLESLKEKALSDGKKLIYPKCISNEEMIALCPSSQAGCFEKGYCDIPEPIESKCVVVKPEEIDLVICPCTSFDESCNRMGMGGGFYDRYLTKCKNAKICAAAFEAQKSKALPSDSWDKPMDAVFTENCTYRFVDCGPLPSAFAINTPPMKCRKFENY